MNFPAYDADVIIAAPLRARGIAGHAVVHAVRALHEANMRIRLIDMSEDATGPSDRFVPPVVRKLLMSGRVDLCHPGGTYRTQFLLCLRPSIVGPFALTGAVVIPDHSVVLVDTEDITAPGFSTKSFVENLKERVTGRISVAPATEAIRSTLSATELLEGEWRMTAAPIGPPRTRVLDFDAAVVGRHSRLEPEWPSNPDVLRAMLPAADNWHVRVFGPVAGARRLLGTVPTSWETRAVANPRAATSIDFWIHASDRGPASSRALEIDEALAAGSVVILPPAYEEHYGQSAVYAEPADVLRTVSELQSNSERFRRQSFSAVDYSETYSASKLVSRLQKLGLRDSTSAGSVVPTARLRSSSRRKRVFFVSSNGAGMGHLTRLLAIARHVPDDIEPVFVSFSLAVPVVAQFGFPYVYIASKNETRLSPNDWNIYCERRLLEEIEEYRPDALFFDGTWPYRGLTEAIRKTGIAAIWSRRAMWKVGVRDHALAKGEYFDAIILPGEFAADADEGVTRGVQDGTQVGPLTVLSREETLGRSEARERLGMGGEARTALITLGAGTINDVNETTRQVVKAFKGLPGQWNVYLTKNPIAAGVSLFQDVYSVEEYPLVRFAAAFDVTVSAAGYNSYHEWIATCVPTLWIPNLNTLTDDQEARANYAEEVGIGVCLRDESAPAIHAAVQRLTNPTSMASMRAELERRFIPNGARDAADCLAAVVRRSV